MVRFLGLGFPNISCLFQVYVFVAKILENIMVTNLDYCWAKVYGLNPETSRSTVYVLSVLSQKTSRTF